MSWFRSFSLVLLFSFWLQSIARDSVANSSVIISYSPNRIFKYYMDREVRIFSPLRCDAISAFPILLTISFTVEILDFIVLFRTDHIHPDKNNRLKNI